VDFDLLADLSRVQATFVRPDPGVKAMAKMLESISRFTSTDPALMDTIRQQAEVIERARKIQVWYEAFLAPYLCVRPCCVSECCHKRFAT
jgi:hypothetical protein